jgi:hypothetical protein
VSSERHEKLLEQMRRLPPVRNIQAIRVYVAEHQPAMLPVVEGILRDATIGSLPAQQIFRFIMVGFAAGRAYQEANPTSAVDPHGYD